MSTLRIKDLHVSVETAEGPKEILKGVNLTINSGEIHAIMGPNGSGKSTMAYALAGHPDYEVTDGEVLLDGVDLLEMSVDERARAGLFLAMQYPVEVPGGSSGNRLDWQGKAIPPWLQDRKTDEVPITCAGIIVDGPGGDSYGVYVFADPKIPESQNRMSSVLASVAVNAS